MVLLQPLGYGPHLVLYLLARLAVAGAGETATLCLKLLSGLDEAVGTQFGIGADLGFELHRADGIGGAADGGLDHEARMALEGGVEIARAAAGQRIQRLGSPALRGLLVFERGEAAAWSRGRSPPWRGHSARPPGRG